MYRQGAAGARAAANIKQSFIFPSTSENNNLDVYPVWCIILQSSTKNISEESSSQYRYWQPQYPQLVAPLQPPPSSQPRSLLIDLDLDLQECKQEDFEPESLPLAADDIPIPYATNLLNNLMEAEKKRNDHKN